MVIQGAHPLAVATLAPAYDVIRTPSHCFLDPVKRRVVRQRDSGNESNAFE